MTIGLWGETQVGKTAWLTTALYGEEGVKDCLDLAKSAKSLSKTVEGHWRRLRQGQWVESTAQDYIDLELFRKGGQPVKLRDIRGGLVSQPAWRDQLLDDVKVVLFVLEWRAADIERHLTAIDTAWPSVADRPSGLIFTKCETDFSAENLAWRGQRDWWRQDGKLNPAIIGRFADNVWPTSAYGYCQNAAAAGFPAVLIGEYGQLIPYGIAPRNVGKPLRWAFDQLAAR